MRTTIESVSTTSGFLQNARVDFAPGLNCVIGARGTCKSTLIESIRFAFDSEPLRVAQLVSAGGVDRTPVNGMIRETLGAGSVRCTVKAAKRNEEDTVVLEREIGNLPRIFVDGVREHEHHPVLRSIEIYSQGDLQRIADDPDDRFRIQLIDRPHAEEIERLEKARHSATEELVSFGVELRSLRSHIMALAQEVLPVGSLKEELRQVEARAPNLTPELENERALYEQRRKTLEALREIHSLHTEAVSRIGSLATVLSRLQSLESAIGDSGIGTLPGAIEHTIRLRELVGAVLTTGSEIGELPISQSIQDVEDTYESLNSTFYKLRQDQSAVNESLKQQAHLRRQIEFLEKREAELENARAHERMLLSRRQAAREKTSAIDNEIYALRVSEIDDINRRHAATVHLTLVTGTQSAEYLAQLSSLLTGSRIRAQEDVARALANTFAPSDLVDIVESGSSQQLADVLARDLGQMNRVVAHLSDHVELYSLEAVPVRARLEITMYDEGEPKPVETLSKGQKATALLPLILRPLPYPLLFDQPEDDLDNSFIFRSLIESVKVLKSERQIIFVTHNANIPVLGEADAVIVMRMRTPVEADVPRIGSVDMCKAEILELLEGGAKAFRLREVKYHPLLSGVLADG